MVPGKNDFTQLACRTYGFAYVLVYPQLYAQYRLSGGIESFVAAGAYRSAVLNDPVVGENGVIVKNYCVYICSLDKCFLEAVIYCIHRESWIVLYPRKTLFLRSCNNFTVLNNRRRRIVVISRNS